MVAVCATPVVQMQQQAKQEQMTVEAWDTEQMQHQLDHEPIFRKGSSFALECSAVDMRCGGAATIDVRSLNIFSPKTSRAASDVSTAVSEPDSPRSSFGRSDQSGCEATVAAHWALTADLEPYELPQLAHNLHALHATPIEARCVVDLLGQQQGQDTRSPITPSLVRSRLHPSLRAPAKPLSKNGEAFSNESCPSLSMVLAKLRQKDPPLVLTLRKVDRLPAERAASLLHAYFRRLGPVDAIHIAHSKTKTGIHGSVRLQPSGVAFLVLRNVVDVETALQLGSTQLVGGVEIEIGRYKALDVERFEEFVACELASQGESFIAVRLC